MNLDWEEVGEYYREEVRNTAYSIDWFVRIIRNWSNFSPKMRCWAIRVSFDEMSAYYARDIMAKPNVSDKSGKDDVRDWGFVNVQLSDEEREAAVLDYADPNALWDSLVVSLKDGYKVTLSHDGETDSYCAALSGTNCGKPNERLTLTAWGEDETDALKFLFYKHFTKLDLVWQKPGMKQKRLG